MTIIAELMNTKLVYSILATDYVQRKQRFVDKCILRYFYIIIAFKTVIQLYAEKWQNPRNNEQNDGDQCQQKHRRRSLDNHQGVYVSTDRGNREMAETGSLLQKNPNLDWRLHWTCNYKFLMFFVTLPHFGYLYFSYFFNEWTRIGCRNWSWHGF